MVSLVEFLCLSFFHFSNKYFAVVVRLSKSLVSVEKVAVNGKIFLNLSFYNSHVYDYKYITNKYICKLKIRTTKTHVYEN